MGLTNFMVHRTMKKESKRLAKEVLKLYPETKAKMPEAAEKDIIKAMIFTDDNLEKFKQKTRDMIDICCKTVNGLCYMLAFEGNLRGFMNSRLLQFTTYMDKELIDAGFPKQSLEQKEEILKSLDLAIPHWRELTGE